MSQVIPSSIHSGSTSCQEMETGIFLHRLDTSDHASSSVEQGDFKLKCYKMGHVLWLKSKRVHVTIDIRPHLFHCTCTEIL